MIHGLLFLKVASFKVISFNKSSEVPSKVFQWTLVVMRSFASLPDLLFEEETNENGLSRVYKLYKTVPRMGPTPSGPWGLASSTPNLGPQASHFLPSKLISDFKTRKDSVSSWSPCQRYLQRTKRGASEAREVQSKYAKNPKKRASRQNLSPYIVRGLGHSKWMSQSDSNLASAGATRQANLILTMANTRE